MRIGLVLSFRSLSHSLILKTNRLHYELGAAPLRRRGVCSPVRIGFRPLAAAPCSVGQPARSCTGSVAAAWFPELAVVPCGSAVRSADSTETPGAARQASARQRSTSSDSDASPSSTDPNSRRAY